MVEIFVEVADVRVDGDLVLPLKLSPHLTELGVGTTRGHDVVHDVNVNVIENDAVTVTRGAGDVVYCEDRAPHKSYCKQSLLNYGKDRTELIYGLETAVMTETGRRKLGK